MESNIKINIMSKEEFCKNINFILERRAKVEAIGNLYDEEFRDSFFNPYSRYEDRLVNVLAYLFDDLTDGWISYFLYELDGGKRYEENMVTSLNSGESIPLRTPEDLYELLIDNLKNNINF